MKRHRGDRMVMRWAEAGVTKVLFQGRWWALERGKLYGTRLDKATGKRRIVILEAWR